LTFFFGAALALAFGAALAFVAFAFFLGFYERSERAESDSGQGRKENFETHLFLGFRSLCFTLLVGFLLLSLLLSGRLLSGSLSIDGNGISESRRRESGKIRTHLFLSLGFLFELFIIVFTFLLLLAFGGLL